MSLVSVQCAESEQLGGGVCIKRSPNQSHSGELASGTPLGTAEKLLVICSLKSSVTTVRSYCGGASWGGRGLFGVHFHITVHL